jgi:4-hydroxy-tetrahydrodipicolinate reductase
MQTIILGDGHLGRAIAAGAVDAGWPEPRVLGRPDGGRHDVDALVGTDLVFEASRPEAVRPNLETALAAGCRRFVVGTTAWTADQDAVARSLAESAAAAVVAPNLSLAMAMFMRLVEQSARLFAPIAAFDPFLVEWHRRGKADRPSGTARALVERVESIRGDGSAAPIDVSSVRAGASPGMHLVGWDAPGETVELRHSARDRSAYAAGAIAAARWLLAAPREPGIHAFDEVVDDLLEPAPMAV